MSEVSAERAWSQALALLSRRQHSEAEIREKLRRKGADEAVTESTLAKLRHYRLTDDAEFTAAYVRSNRQRKGVIALRRELERRGIADEVVEAALLPLTDAAQLRNARELLARNAWRFGSPDHRRNRATAFAFLARRGFPAEVAAAAVEGMVPVETPSRHHR